MIDHRGFDVQLLTVWVAAACGCVWSENRPAGLTIDPGEPRACAVHRADHPASRYPSPQGMAMVSVTYYAEDPRTVCRCTLLDYADDHSPYSTCKCGHDEDEHEVSGRCAAVMARIQPHRPSSSN